MAPAKRAAASVAADADAATPSAGGAQAPPAKRGRIEEVYKTMSDLQHALAFPSQYIGSVEPEELTDYVFDAEAGRMTPRTTRVAPGLLHLFEEPLMNALDRLAVEGSGVTRIDVAAAVAESGRVVLSVRNDGDGIPSDVHPEAGCRVPELLFGRLRSSSNYHDRREGAGTHGVGVTLTNLFSVAFDVETVHDGKLYRQSFAKNLSHVGEPRITAYTRAPYTLVRFEPDYARFGVPDPSDAAFVGELLARLERRVRDAAVFCGERARVTWNGRAIKERKLAQYAQLFLEPPPPAAADAADADGGEGEGEGEGPGPNDADARSESAASASAPGAAASKRPRPRKAPAVAWSFERDGCRWEVVAGRSPGADARQISWANGAYTRLGGYHVETVAARLVGAIAELYAADPRMKKHASEGFGAMIRARIFLFVSARIPNPTFREQTKVYMLRGQGPRAYEMPAEVAARVDRSLGIRAEVLEAIERRVLARTNREIASGARTVGGRVVVPKYESANKAGSRERAKCTLVLAEGDSARAAFLSGLSPKDRDYFGIYALRGVPLNARDKGVEAIGKNAEYSALCKILGLRYGEEAHPERMRYGGLLIASDADLDGIRIRGLLLNFFATKFPSLVDHPAFPIRIFKTPIVRASRGKTVIPFYSDAEFRAWRASLSESELRRHRITYLKGLGSNDASEMHECIHALDRHTIRYSKDEKAEERLEMAYGKAHSDRRKEWLSAYREDLDEVDHSAQASTLTDFVDRELVKYASHSVVRAVPLLSDGLKTSQRKIVWVTRSEAASEPVKVAQLAGTVALKTAYHHGEQSLAAAIVCLGQSFVGSGNNLPLLATKGIFGTRMQLGNDASAPRYIFARIAPIVAKVYRAEDDPILERLESEGSPIEPRTLAPVFPIVLCNAQKGIATGFATEVPCYHPRTLVRLTRRLVSGGTLDRPADEPLPWYRDFQGTVERAEGGKGASVQARGVVAMQDGGRTAVVTELPPSRSVDAFVEHLQRLCEKDGREVESYRNATGSDKSGKLTIRFEVRLASPRSEEEAVALLGLAAPVRVNQIVLFSPETGRVRHYPSPLDVIEEFVRWRRPLYARRKEAALADLAERARRAALRARYVADVASGTLRPAGKGDAEAVAEMVGAGYPREDCDALLDLPIRSATSERAAKLREEADRLLAEEAALRATPPDDLWLRDLDELERALA